MKPTSLTALACLLAGVLAAPAPAGADTQLRRFALAIGVNDGGPDRVILRYAGSDAKSFSRVLRELGGTGADDVELLVEPTIEGISDGFARLRTRMERARQSGARVELIVYYSGHSDDEGLLVAGRRMSYAALRQQIRAMPADVHIAVLDSCASGAFTRTKGGKKGPAFAIDQAHRVHGHAFLSSSSANEQAQESDRLGGSFFTHYLVGGLRGAADINRDRRVTLAEAYQFAFNETVNRTERTRHGVQHPAYEMHLAGTGDVILTDLRATSAALVLAGDLGGRVFIRDDRGQLVLELGKLRGAPLVLGLAPGTYDLTLEDGDRRFRAAARLRQGRRTTVAAASFVQVALEPSVARGAELRYRTVPFNLDLFDVPGEDDRELHRFSFNLLVGGGAALDGFEMGLVNLRSERADGFQLAGIANMAGAGSDGVRIAGGGNLVRGRARGASLAGIGNHTHGDASGVQMAGIGNLVTGETRGLQIAGIGNIAGAPSTRAVQIAAIGNIVDGTAGVQMAAIGNSAAGVGGDGFGAQVAAIGNLSTDDVRGIQLAAIGNLTLGDVRGAQIGMVNVVDELRGAQVGLVNVSRRPSGAQVGLVNVATESGAGSVPLGLLNVAPDGHHAVEAWVADIIPVRVGGKLGSGPVYTLLAVGSSTDYHAAGLGLGLHLPQGSFWIDTDLSSYALFEHDFSDPEDVDQLAELRGVVGVPLGIGLSVFAGVAVSSVVTWGDKPGRDLALLTVRQMENDDVSVRISPGVLAGVSY
jgi:hypothetical protein